MIQKYPFSRASLSIILSENQMLQPGDPVNVDTLFAENRLIAPLTPSVS
jgi:hypothetical protein